MFDVLVVGSGPAGWTAAIYAVRAGLRVGVVTSEVDWGGALMNTTVVENYPGFADGVLGPVLMEQMAEQAKNLGVIVLYEDAVSVDVVGKVVHTEENVYEARSLILAMGAAHRSLGVPGEVEYSGAGVSSCATCDGFFFKGKEVIVVGDGDSAMEEALYLSKLAEHVTIVHRRDSFRASATMVERVLGTENITVLWNSVVTEICGDGHAVTGVELTDGSVRLADGVFVAIGLDPRSDLVAGQVEVSSTGHVLVVDDGSSTTCCYGVDGKPVPGVFACGDLVDSLYRQAITAAGSGCRAGLDAQRYLESLSS